MRLDETCCEYQKSAGNVCWNGAGRWKYCNTAGFHHRALLQCRETKSPSKLIFGNKFNLVETCIFVMGQFLIRGALFSREPKKFRNIKKKFRWFRLFTLPLFLTRPVNMEEIQPVKNRNLSRLIANSVSSLPQSCHGTRNPHELLCHWRDNSSRSRKFARHYSNTIAQPRSIISSVEVQPPAQLLELHTPTFSLSYVWLLHLGILQTACYPPRLSSFLHPAFSSHRAWSPRIVHARVFYTACKAQVLCPVLSIFTRC